MKKLCVIITVICFAGMSTGCGHVLFPKPPAEQTMKPVDAKLNCDDLQKEVVDMRYKQDQTMGGTGQAVFNVLNFAVGFFTLFNWFLIDFSTGRDDVIKSFADREQYLAKLCEEKGCELPAASIRKPDELVVTHKPATEKAGVRRQGGNVVATDGPKLPGAGQPSLF